MERKEKRLRKATISMIIGMVAIVGGVSIFMATFPSGAMLLTIFLLGEIIFSLWGIKIQNFDITGLSFPKASLLNALFIVSYGASICSADRIDIVLSAAPGTLPPPIVALRWFCVCAIVLGRWGLVPLFKPWNKE